MRILTILPLMLLLGGCNYVTLKPGTMDTGTVIYADANGYSIKRAIKDELAERGYDVRVGKIKNYANINDVSGTFVNMKSYEVPANTKYVIDVQERREKFQPVWCFFNGYWWWNFNVSISDQENGTELMSWAGRGCMNSSIRKFNRLMDKLEREIE